MPSLSVWPTDGADGSVANEARWRKMGRHWTPTGVLAGVGGQLKPTLAGTSLTVADGAAWVDGHYCELLGSQVLTVTANGIAVVRFDPAANTAELVWRDGVTVPAQSPTGVFEMLIASTTGSVLADRRAIVGAGNAKGGQVVAQSLSSATFESADIATATGVAILPAVPVVAGHAYLVNSTVGVLSRVANNSGAQVYVNTDFPAIANLCRGDFFMPALGYAMPAYQSVIWVPGATGTAVIDLKMNKAAWTAGAVRYVTGTANPMNLAVIDLGPTPT